MEPGRCTRAALLLAACTIAAASCGAEGGSTAGVTVFEGARLIPGDGSGPVENGVFTLAGPAGEMQVPERAVALMAASGSDSRPGSLLRSTGRVSRPADRDGDTRLCVRRLLKLRPAGGGRRRPLPNGLVDAGTGVLGHCGLRSSIAPRRANMRDCTSTPPTTRPAGPTEDSTATSGCWPSGQAITRSSGFRRRPMPYPLIRPPGRVPGPARQAPG